MPYKYQGFGGGPTTPRMWIGIIVTLIVIFALYGAMAWWLLTWPAVPMGRDEVKPDGRLGPRGIEAHYLAYGETCKPKRIVMCWTDTPAQCWCEWPAGTRE